MSYGIEFHRSDAEIKNERISRPEPKHINDLPRVATELPAIPGISWLSWPPASLGTVGVNT